MTDPSDHLDPSGPEDDLDEVSRHRAERASARLRAATAAMVEQDPDPAGPESDVAALLEVVTQQIRRESRAGRDVSIGPGGDEPDRLVMTEGALRAAIRDAVDAVPGVLVGRVRLRGALEELGTAVGAEVRVSVRASQPLRPTAEAARRAVARVLSLHTGRPVGDVDVAVVDVHVVGAPSASREGER